MADFQFRSSIIQAVVEMFFTVCFRCDIFRLALLYLHFTSHRQMSDVCGLELVKPAGSDRERGPPVEGLNTGLQKRPFEVPVQKCKLDSGSD